MDAVFSLVRNLATELLELNDQAPAVAWLRAWEW